MMRNTIAVLAMLLMTGCSGNPLDGAPPDDGGGGTPTPGAVTVPADLAQNLRGATYDPRRGTLKVDLRSLDTGDRIRGTYRRDPLRDVAGYQAFVAQENSSNRIFTGLFRESRSGAVRAGVVADGGQFRSYFAGGTYSRSGAFSMPARGIASYSGKYVGLQNTGVTVPGPGPVFDPQVSDRTRGEVLINADFGNMTVNGAIRNRENVRTGVNLIKQDLRPTAILANGSFGGTMGPELNTDSGTYAGVFGGRNASDVAGIVKFNPVDGNADLFEHGAFVLPKCRAGSASPCP